MDYKLKKRRSILKEIELRKQRVFFIFLKISIPSHRPFQHQLWYL